MILALTASTLIQFQLTGKNYDVLSGVARGPVGLHKDKGGPMTCKRRGGMARFHPATFQ